MEEPQIIQGLKAKNEAVFSVFVENYKDRVYNTALSILQNPSDAEDIAQEVFMDIWKNSSQFRAEAQLSTWVYQITVNCCRDFLKWKKRKKRFAFITSLYGEEQNLRYDNPDFVHPGVQLEQQEQAKVLLRAIARLPEQQRVAFSLHKMEGLPYQEIAGILGKSLSSIESLMHRAKQNLQKHLRSYYESMDT